MAPNQWRSQPGNLGGAKKIWGAIMFDFRRMTLRWPPLATPMRPTCFDLKKWRPKSHENRKKVAQNCFGQFGEIWAKIFRTLINLPAPTRMLHSII